MASVGRVEMPDLLTKLVNIIQQYMMVLVYKAIIDDKFVIPLEGFHWTFFPA
ncbi:MAG: hypothetical protein HON18_12855 [Rhodospirillaceae bacterium]|nr:hypothetical protein [Rhodospirillaceae bacterium]